jgi:hypothetical protein
MLGGPQTYYRIVFQRHDFAQKSQCPEHQKCVSTFHQHEYPPQQIFAQYTVFDVVRMVFHTERQQLQHQAEQLHGVIVFIGRRIVDCVGQQGCCEKKEKENICI